MSIFGSKESRTPRAAGSARPAPQSSGLSIIAPGMVVRGDIETVGVVKVEGAVEGSIHSRVQVLVARGGSVSGDIETVEAVVGGTVRGAIRAEERVEIQSGAVVNGDITTSRISVAEGGSINGQIRMGEPRAGEPLREMAEGRLEPRAVTPPSMTRPSVPAGRVALPPRVGQS